MSLGKTKLDMTMMYLVHDALRRDLRQIEAIARRGGDDPQRILRTALGWDFFKRFLHVHHTTEDVAIWPVMMEKLDSRPADLALMEAMEQEHARIDPLLESIDAALADRDHGHERLSDLIDALRGELTGHLSHEESESLKLIDEVMSEEEWDHFASLHRENIGADGPRYMPWVLEEGDPARVASLVSKFPPPMRTAYEDVWTPAFAKLRRWEADSLPVPG